MSSRDVSRSVSIQAGRLVATPFLGSALASTIQAEKDRALSDGATIEAGVYTDLIDPIYDVLKGAGEWSNVVAFYSAGVRKLVSGSVSKLYDQSGNQNDATQSTSSKRPTNVDGLQGGKDGIHYDGSDDWLKAGTTNVAQPNTVVSLLDRKNSKSASWDGDQSRGWHLFNNGPSSIFAGSIAQLNNKYSAGLKFWTVVYNGASSNAYINGSQDGPHDAGTNNAEGIFLGRNQPNKNFADDDALGYIFFNSEPSSSVRSDLRSRFKTYYSL